MPDFDDDIFEEQEQKYPSMMIGTVVKRDTEYKRVRVMIPGFMEPEGPWAYPLGSGGGGSKDRGMIGLPAEGATVAIWFANGDPERPYYMSANWGDDEIPEEAAERDDAVIWSSETFCIMLDETEGERKLLIKNRKTDDYIELDPENNYITINGTTLIKIEAIGMITLDAAQLILNGRKVLPISSPI